MTLEPAGSEAPRPAPQPETVTAAVRFTDDRRPERATHVRLATFDGPLGLLLALIEQQKLDVLTVRLGELAEAYLTALADLPGERLPHLSTFVGVAAQLILIKSRALLPAPPGPPVAAAEEATDPEEELRRRLMLYRAFRDAGQRLGARLSADAGLFHREASVAASAGLAGARPAPEPPLDPASLAAALVRTAALALPPDPTPAVVARAITLAERVEVLRAALRAAPDLVLQDLLAGSRDRVLVAVTFLALLELVKRREVVADQREPWGPIRCRRVPRLPGSAALTGDAVVDPVVEPIDESLADFA